MLESLQSILRLMDPPSKANVGEAYMLHQSLSAYYFLHAKCSVYEAHTQMPELRNWYNDLKAAIESRINDLTQAMSRRGISLPPSIPSGPDLTDQFILLDGAAMIKGMVTTDAMGIQAARQPDLAVLFHKMFNGALIFGAKLVPIAEREGWDMNPPSYPQSKGNPG